MIKAILIDDEQSAVNVLTSLLKRTPIDIDILTTCSNLEEGVVQIKELKPNVVFLDIQMPNYAGYEIVKFFDKIDFEIIFVTAYDKYAIKAFELNAIDYLVKPVDRVKLAITLTKLEKRLVEQTALVDYQNLLETIKDRNYKKIVIPESGNRRVVKIEDIMAIEAEGSYSIIHIKNNTSVTASKNLKYFEEILPKEATFYRSHRTWIINLNYIESLNKTDQTITLVNKKIIAKISRARMDDFETILNA